MLPIEIVISIVIVFFAIVLHECAHGWVANKLGDPTAKLAGRLTLNPLRHIDPFGTIILPAALMILRAIGFHTFVFGWAKPVPVDFARLRHPKRDIMLVGIAGPVVNFILAFLFSQLFKLELPQLVYEIAASAVYVNLLLAIFNLTPVPPLDGSRVVMGLLPNSLARAYSRLEPYGIFFVVVLLSFNYFDRVVEPLLVLCGNALGVRF